MKRLFAGGTCVAVAFAWSVMASAQAGQPPAPSAAADSQKAPAQQVTIIGCVQKEADYRKAKDMGRGGAVGTGVGAGNEFVLINAATAPAGSTGTAFGTSGTASGTEAYELTGTNEGKAEPFVGKRVEIVGTLKSAETGPSGATGGATAGKPPAGVDVASADLKLRELEIVSVRESTGTCPTIR